MPALKVFIIKYRHICNVWFIINNLGRGINIHASGTQCLIDSNSCVRSDYML